MKSGPTYYTLALQLLCRAVNGAGSRQAAEDMMKQSVRHVGRAIKGAVGFHGDIKLVVLPEYFMTGHPAGESIPAWRELAAIDMDGPQIDALRELASQQAVYLAGNAYEADAKFPTLYFQTSFVLSPSGETVLRYRRLISMYTPSPYDVIDRYIDLYGKESLFPVADTDCGRIAAIASEEILYPEIARCLAMRGAEIFVHSTSEAALRGLSPKNLAKRARAMENMAYVISANSAGIIGGSMLQDATDTGSQVVDYRGNVLLEADSGESMNVVHEIDVAALRRARRRVSMSNTIARQPMRLYADAYGATESPALPNSLIGVDNAIETPQRSFFRERQRAAIDRLAKLGII